MKRPVGLVAIGVAALLAVPAQSAKSEFNRPPYAGAYQPQGVDERGIWMEVDEQERALRDSAYILRDEKLTQYVRRTLCRTVGEDRCQSVRIYIVENEVFNASMAPNGLMRVHTGLLARLHSEAELAAVLGHEFAHFEQRHSLHGFRKQRTTDDILQWVQLAGAFANQNTSALQASLVGSFYRFGREQEQESDVLASKFLQSSPYRPRSSEIWKRITEENDALRAERGLRKLRKLLPDFADSHPPTEQRFLYLRKIEAEAGSEGEEGFAEFGAATAQIMPKVLAALAKGNEFGAADYIIKSRGDALGWDAPLLYARGELYRQRANPRDLATARGFYEQASAKPDAPAETWRGLGLTAMRLGDAGAGKAALSEYMKRAPEALDAKSIKLLLEN